MTQDVDIQLQVWKDLAISKQILMGAATDALGLDSDCSTSELKIALDKAILRAKDADSMILDTRTKADQDVADMKRELKLAVTAKDEAEAKVSVSDKARETAERQMTIGKAENNDAIKKAKADVNDKQNQLKAISKALADTPENVVKKLKVLKKQKLDEAKLKTQTEAKLQTTRKEKSKVEAELKGQKEGLKSSADLIKQVKALHEICSEAQKTIKKLSEDKKDQIKVPKLDKETIEFVEKLLKEK